MDFEHNNDDNDRETSDEGSNKIEITWLTIALWAALIALIAFAIYLTREYPVVPPP